MKTLHFKNKTNKLNEVIDLIGKYDDIMYLDYGCNLPITFGFNGDRSIFTLIINKNIPSVIENNLTKDLSMILNNFKN